MQQDYDNGKYTVIFDRETGELRALRNGEVWQDLSGNKLVYWMLVEHKRALERIAELEKDAARYQLRLETIRALYPSAPSDIELDTAIDAAMQGA